MEGDGTIPLLFTGHLGIPRPYFRLVFGEKMNDESKPRCSTCVHCLIEWNAADDRRLFCLNGAAKAADLPVGYLLTGTEAESCALYAEGKPQEENVLTEILEDHLGRQPALKPTFLPVTGDPHKRSTKR